MAKFGGKPKKLLSDEGHNGMFLVLTERNCLKARYASAFLAAFSTELEEQLADVFQAGHSVNAANNGPVHLGLEQTQHILEVAIAIIAIAQYRRLNAYSRQFAPDVEKSIWAIIFVLRKVAENIDAAVVAQVLKSVERALGDPGEYFDDPKIALAAIEWEDECCKTLESYNSGAICDDEFQEQAYELLGNRPRNCIPS